MDLKCSSAEAGAPREFFMSFGLLNECLQLVGDITTVSAITVDHRLRNAVISSIFSGGPYEAAWGSPGARIAAAHLLKRRIRKSEVTSGLHALRPHDMPMARYHTSRLRRSPRYLAVGS